MSKRKPSIPLKRYRSDGSDPMEVLEKRLRTGSLSTLADAAALQSRAPVRPAPVQVLPPPVAATRQRGSIPELAPGLAFDDECLKLFEIAGYAVTALRAFRKKYQWTEKDDADLLFFESVLQCTERFTEDMWLRKY